MPVWEKSSPAGVKDSGEGGTSVSGSEKRGGQLGRECARALKRRHGPADTLYNQCVCV